MASVVQLSDCSILARLQPRGLHWWCRLEAQTRARDGSLSLHLVPAWAAAFTKAGAAPAAEAAEHDGEAGGAETEDETGGAAAGAEEEDSDEEQEQAPSFQAASEQQLFQVLTAAALVGGWWGPTAEADGGTARRQALQMIGSCLGQELAKVVEAMTK